MCKVSVIIPNYNHSRFLNQRIDSVLNQTFQDFELIIMDDCSTDNSREIIEAYRDHTKVSKIILNEHNSGTTFKQWHKGIESAKGKYIWLAESDDFAAPTLLEKLVSLMDSSSNLGLAYCNSLIVNEQGQITDDTKKWNPGLHQEGMFLHTTGIKKGKSFCFEHLIYINVIPNASAVLFRRDIVINNINWIDCSLRNTGDWKLWLHILLKYDFGYACEDLNYFRKHSNNVTGSVFRIKLETIRILKELMHEINDQEELSKLYNSLFIWSFKHVYWSEKYFINHSNIRFYFRNNISFKSVKYFCSFCYKLINNKTLPI